MRIGRLADGRICRVEGEQVVPLVGDPFLDDPFLGEAGSGGPLRRAEVELIAPVLPEHLLVVLGGFPVGRTREEAREHAPRLAAKLRSTIRAAGEPVVIPDWVTSEVSVEPELAVVIGKPLRQAAPEDASAAIFGFVCFNDVTVLDFIRREHDFLKAKSLDTFGPMGSEIVTDVTERDVENGLDIRATVNGDVVHEGNTRWFTHRVSEVVSAASFVCTLVPGDVISLGTPPDPHSVHRGDHVVVEVEKVGKVESLVQ